MNGQAPSPPRVLNKRTDRIPRGAYYCGRPWPLPSSSDPTAPATRSSSNTRRGS